MTEKMTEIEADVVPESSTTKDITTEEEEKPWIEYFKPDIMTRLLHKKFALFGSLIGLYYVI